MYESADAAAVGHCILFDVGPGVWLGTSQGAAPQLCVLTTSSLLAGACCRHPFLVLSTGL